MIQIFATGLSGTGVITAKIGSEVVTQPYYAGPAPGFAGLQQIDLILPSDLTGNTVNVSVCGGPTAAQVICSPSVSVAIRNRYIDESVVTLSIIHHSATHRSMPPIQRDEET